MIALFLVALWLTLLITRIIAHNLHDMKNYGTLNEKSKTPTGLLRKITGWDIHHIHIGLPILVVILPFIIIYGLSDITVILLAISLSFIADQTIPLIDRKSNYFHKSKLMISIIFHLMISIIIILFMPF